MSSVLNYFSGIYKGIGSLLLGMSVTIKELFTKKVTREYPENRATLVISPRFRAELTMPHDENNEHACTACGICEMNCPNGTITVKSKMIETPEGKKKKVLDEYFYDLGKCTFCNLCVISCPSKAIIFSNHFENAVFTRTKLHEKLNQEGSKLREKVPARKPVTPTTATSGKETENQPKTAVHSTEPVREEKVPVPENKETEEGKQ